MSPQLQQAEVPATVISSMMNSDCSRDSRGDWNDQEGHDNNNNYNKTKHSHGNFHDQGGHNVNNKRIFRSTIQLWALTHTPMVIRLLCVIPSAYLITRFYLIGLDKVAHKDKTVLDDDLIDNSAFMDPSNTYRGDISLPPNGSLDGNNHYNKNNNIGQDDHSVRGGHENMFINNNNNNEDGYKDNKDYIDVMKDKANSPTFGRLRTMSEMPGNHPIDGPFWDEKHAIEDLVYLCYNYVLDDDSSIIMTSSLAENFKDTNCEDEAWEIFVYKEEYSYYHENSVENCRCEKANDGTSCGYPTHSNDEHDNNNNNNYHNNDFGTTYGQGDHNDRRDHNHNNDDHDNISGQKCHYKCNNNSNQPNKCDGNGRRYCDNQKDHDAYSKIRNVYECIIAHEELKSHKCPDDKKIMIMIINKQMDIDTKNELKSTSQCKTACNSNDVIGILNGLQLICNDTETVGKTLNSNVTHEHNNYNTHSWNGDGPMPENEKIDIHLGGNKIICDSNITQQYEPVSERDYLMWNHVHEFEYSYGGTFSYNTGWNFLYEQDIMKMSVLRNFNTTMVTYCGGEFLTDFKKTNFPRVRHNRSNLLFGVVITLILYSVMKMVTNNSNPYDTNDPFHDRIETSDMHGDDTELNASINMNYQLSSHDLLQNRMNNKRFDLMCLKRCRDVGMTEIDKNISNDTCL